MVLLIKSYDKLWQKKIGTDLWMTKLIRDKLDKFNDESGDVKIEQVPWKIDGSTVCISGGFETPFIALGMHFVREDTCFEYYIRKKKILTKLS